MNNDYGYETYKPEIKCEGKPKVAFVCVHNSCRSQIAEALGKNWLRMYLKVILLEQN